MATGRTTYKYVNFIVKVGATLRCFPLVNMGVVGITYDQHDLTAWQDAIKGTLPTMPDAPITATFLFDNTAAAALPALSGSMILEPLNGALTPFTVDVQFGIQKAWTAGDPQFGITGAAGVGYLLYKFDVAPDGQTVDTEFRLFPGSTIPLWGTAAEA